MDEVNPGVLSAAVHCRERATELPVHYTIAGAEVCAEGGGHGRGAAGGEVSHY